MDFRTEVNIEKADFEIQPSDSLLFVGSCFADHLGNRFVENRFRAMVNPYGVMYNPTSVYHSVDRYLKGEPCTAGLKAGTEYQNQDRKVDVAVFTLGTNHVYILKETG